MFLTLMTGKMEMLLIEVGNAEGGVGWWWWVAGPRTGMVAQTSIALLNGHCPFKILPFPLNPPRPLLDLLALIYRQHQSF